MVTQTRLHINVAAPQAAIVLEEWGWKPYAPLVLPVAPDGSCLSAEDTELVATLAWKLRERSGPSFGERVLRHPFREGSNRAYTSSLSDPTFADEVNHAVEGWLAEQRTTQHQALDPVLVELTTPHTPTHTLAVLLSTFSTHTDPYQSGKWTLALPRQVVPKVLRWFNNSSGNVGTGGPALSSLFTRAEAMETTFQLWEPGSGTALAWFAQAREVAEALHAPEPAQARA